MPPCTINLAFYLRVMTSHQGYIFGFTAEMTPSILTGILFQVKIQRIRKTVPCEQAGVYKQIELSFVLYHR